jgi:hypothetical protein
MPRLWGRDKFRDEQKEAIAESAARRKIIQSQWAFIFDQIVEGRAHREENHIRDLIVGVARGQKP